MKRVRIRVGARGFGRTAAFLITVLVVYLAVCSVPEKEIRAPQGGSGKRITREILLKGGTCAFVHFGCFENASDARMAGARYMPRGAAGYVLEAGEGFYAAGCLFESGEEAESMCAAISREGIDCGYAPLTACDVRLRVTAEEERIKLLESSYAAYLSAERELMRLSGHLDAGNIASGEAQALLSVLRYDLKGLSGKNAEAAEESTGIGKTLFSTLSDGLACAELTCKEGSGDEMRLSSRIKYAALEMRIQRYGFLASLQ